MTGGEFEGGGLSPALVARPVLAVLAVVAASVLAGCGTAHNREDDVRAGEARGASGEAPCGFASLASLGGDTADVSTAEPLRDDVVVPAVRRCYSERELVPGDGEWQTVRTERATGPSVGALVQALRLPSEPPTSGACAAVGVDLVVVDVETDQGAARPGPRWHGRSGS